MPFASRTAKESAGGRSDASIDVEAVIARALNRSLPPAAATLTDAPPPLQESAAAPEMSAAQQPAPAYAQAPTYEPSPAYEPPLAKQPTPTDARAETSSAGYIEHIPLQTPSDGDPLLAEVVALGKSLLYDLWYVFGPHGWAEIFVELPPTGDPSLTTRFGNTWDDWEPSGHSLRLLGTCRELLAESDPDAGYDLLVRHDEVVVCQWPRRAWDVPL